MAARLTPPEERLVDRYVSALDYVSRCAQAIDEGHRHYLWDKAGELRGAAAQLAQLLGEFEGRPPARPDVVLAAVQHHGRHYRAGRLLHPARVELTTSEACSILPSVAGSAGVLASEADQEELRRDSQGIAERTDLAPATVARVLCALRRWEVRSVE